MQKILAVLILILLPASASAAPSSFSATRSLLVASSTLGNAYAAGITIVVTAPVTGDFSAVGGSIVTASPIQGDALLLAGSVHSRAIVSGDLRIFGGRANIEAPVRGDLVAFGVSVHSAGRPGGSVLAMGANVTLADGAAGPVTIYGNNVALAGNFSSDVRIFSSGRVTLAPETTIRGTLKYESPEPAAIPATATITGGVTYTNASYLPDAGTSRILAVVSIGFFLFARILGALILAGLLAGLFPKLAEAVANRLYTKNPRSMLLTMLLGFAILVATPVLLMLLALTFVGIGLALLLFMLYGLLVMLSVLYAGILMGSIFARRFARRERVLWRDGALGMLVFSVIALVPVIGLPVTTLFTLYAAGALLQLFFAFAFPHEEKVIS